MPTLPTPKCANALCTNRTESRKRSLCIVCQREKYKADALHEADPFYWTPAWRSVRLNKLKRDPLCCECLKINLVKRATVVDHIIPRRLGGADFADDNLQSMCAAHHNKKRAKERGQTRGTVISVTIWFVCAAITHISIIMKSF